MTTDTKSATATAADMSAPPMPDVPAAADAPEINGANGKEQDSVTANGIVFTDNAARKVKELIEEEKNPALMLRVFISGGGCSGFQYGFTFDEERADDDFSLEKTGVTILIDPMSYQFLSGAQIDYKEGLEGSQFVIRNPNVASTCGCGSSFSV